MKIFCLTNQDQIDLLSSYITLNFNFSENLKIDIDKLIAKQDQSTDNLATQRIVFFDLVKKSLSTMQIDEFTNSLS